MMLSEGDKHAAKKVGTDTAKYIVVCVVFAVLWVAYDTQGFTKKPSWWSLGLMQTQPALTSIN